MSLSFKGFLNSKPSLRYVFFGGKGGVGKSTLSSATGYYLSEILGKRTLVSSTDPVHSLSNTFSQDFWGKGIQKVGTLKNLWCFEIDVSQAIEEHKKNVSGKILTFLKYADIPVNPGPFIDAATTNPAFEEAAMFDMIIDTMLKGDFDIYVFDTAPVAHTYRLLGMSRVYDLWLRKMVKSREEAMSLRAKLSFRREKIIEEIRKDPLLAGLLATRQRTEQGRMLLTDAEKTAFFFVTIPQSLPISVIERFIGWVRAFSIPVGGVLVNGVLPKEQLDNVSVSYVVNKLEEQVHYLKVIEQKFPGLVRAHLPLYEKGVIGIDMIGRLAEALQLEGLGPAVQQTS